MKFSVGYQHPNEGGERFAEIVADYAEHVAEVYFAWGDAASARSPAASASGFGAAVIRARFLENITFIRPEDLPRYAGCADLFKLATRTHANPRLVLEAYSSGRFTGNLFDLTEPSHGPRFPNRILDNVRFPPGWWETRAHCAHACDACGRCRTFLPDLLVDSTENDRI